MPEPRWTCHYDYPGCASGRMCRACVNDLHLWGQIKPSLAVATTEHAQELGRAVGAALTETFTGAPVADDYSGIIIGEHPDGSATVLRDSDRLTWRVPRAERANWNLRPYTEEEDRRIQAETAARDEEGEQS